MESLTKSDFLAGHQCAKLLWLRRHEPTALELQPDLVLQDLFDQGSQVGVLARERLGDGTLIPSDTDRATRLARTAEAIAARSPQIYEGAFEADGLFVAVDALLLHANGWQLIEVKSASAQKDAHVTDVGVQAHVLAACGHAPVRLDVMHLNKGFAHPDTGDLFARTDVSDQVAGAGLDVGEVARRSLAVLQGAMPQIAIGAHCFEPRDCVFMQRCWPADPRHISRLYNVGAKKTVAYMAAGVHTVDDLAPNTKLADAAIRQLASLNTGRRIVEPTLPEALEPFAVMPLGFLDFETIARAVPVWPGMAPWGQAAAQFSYHESLPGGGYRHEEFLAEGPGDARPAIARRLVEATRSAKRVVMYSSFERTQIRALAKCVPELADELHALDQKLLDLLPIVRNHVYDPGFAGSFSIKAVLPALVPELSYSDLVIVNGLVASVEIARLLFVAERIPEAERERVRRDLLEYCRMDTWATVRLLETLRELRP